MIRAVSCDDCNAILPSEWAFDDTESRHLCPACGSKIRSVSIELEDTVKFKEKIGLKQKEGGVGKPIFESVSGDDLHRLSDRWNKLVRIIDRKNDYYYERVTDPETGRVIRECEEPLSHHIGRGTAKYQQHDIPHDDIAVAAYHIWIREGCPDGRDKEHWNMAIEQLKRAKAGIEDVQH